MYPDTPPTGPGDDMDPASRREFFGPGRRRGQTAEPPITPALGDGFQKPFVPDPTDDHPLSTRTQDSSAYRSDPPSGVSRPARGRDEDLIDNAGYDGDAPEQRHRHDEDPYPGRYAANE